jgi:hypothetical protein
MRNHHEQKSGRLAETLLQHAVAFKVNSFPQKSQLEQKHVSGAEDKCTCEVCKQLATCTALCKLYTAL